jgi:hypothetical protein
MERVQEWDSLFGDLVGSFLQGILLETFFHEDNAIQMYGLAHELGVPLSELCSYVWLQTYVRELREDFETLPAFQLVCQHFGIDPEKFHSYILREDELARSVLGPEWGGEANLMDDIQQDAEDGMFGD